MKYLFMAYATNGLPSRTEKTRLKTQLCGLRSLEHPAADLTEFTHQVVRVPAGERCSIYFRSKQNGGCQISTAFKAKPLDPSWKVHQFRNTTTHTTVTNKFLINTLQIV